ARRHEGWPFRPTRGAGPRRRRALSPREQSFRIDLASQRKEARRREWQRQRDVSSSPDANSLGKDKGRRKSYEVFARFRMVTKIAVSSSHSCRKGASFFALTTPDSTSSCSQ